MVKNSLALSPEQEARAMKLHRESIVIDALGGRMWPEPPQVDGKSYVTRLQESGVTACTVTLAAHADGLDAVLKEVYGHANLLYFLPDQLMLVETVDDIIKAKETGRVGLIFGMQSGTPVERRIELWTVLHKLGLRQVQLCYNERTVFGDGCYEPANGHLTWFGVQAVNECNRLGILLDCSHMGEQTTLDIIERSSKPVVFSHSNTKKLMPHSRRCVTDEQIKACAAKGGVIGLSPHTFMSAKDPGLAPKFEDYLDHFEYVAQLVGIDHVGIGSDMFEAYTKISWESSTKRMYPGPWTFETMYPPEFHKITDFPNVTRGLVGRGFSDSEIKRILSENWMRVFREVWKP
jgi:membrane dipeptidase